MCEESAGEIGEVAVGCFGVIITSNYSFLAAVNEIVNDKNFVNSESTGITRKFSLDSY
jgi:hypothetical protein